MIAALLIASAMSTQPYAADVKIGVIYPLTGNAASAGQSAKDAVELGAEIVNKGYPELKSMPVGGTAGLPNLGGAKIVLDQADHQGNPQVGQQQTLRLITQDRVVAMLGSYHSSVSLVATAAAERQGGTRFVSMQNHVNLVYREEEREMIPFCIDQGIAVLPWSPLARGLLAGNKTREGERLTTRAGTDAFGSDRYFVATGVLLTAVALAASDPMTRDSRN